MQLAEAQVDIRIGGPPPVGPPAEKTALPTGVVEAKVLALRPPRSRTDGVPPDGEERRETKAGTDARGGRVLVLFVPDAQQLPEGLDSGAFRVFLRFARR
jgi:hypothetical protein